MNFESRTWVSRSGWKMLSGLLIGLGLLLWAVGKYLDGPLLSTLGPVMGQCFVGVGLIIAILALWRLN